MQQFTDHIGRTIEIPFPPRKIISFCPAITNTLFALGLNETIIGRTRFCIHPKSKVDRISIVGGTKDLNIDKVRALTPDLIIAEKEENTKEMVAQLEKEFPVYVFEVQSIHDNTRMIQDLGRLVHKETEASQLNKTITTAFKKLPNLQGKRAAYVIWRTPYMVVGQSTYINTVIESLQLVNPFISLEGRYPIVTVEDLKQANLDYLFLATEPFRFQEKHVQEFSTLLPNVTVSLIDGEMFWYGVNMLAGAKYLKDQFK